MSLSQSPIKSRTSSHPKTKNKGVKSREYLLIEATNKEISMTKK